VVPVRASAQTPRDLYYGWIGQDRTYTFLMETLKLRGLADPEVYRDEHIREVIVGNYRNLFFRLTSSYVDQIQAWQQSLGQLDSLQRAGAAADSVAQLRSELSLQVDSARQRIARLTERSAAQLPPELIPVPDLTALIQTQALASVGLYDLAEPLLTEALSRSLATLRIYREAGRPIDQRDNDLRVALVSVQFYLQKGEPERAEAIAAEIQAAIGSELGYRLIEQMKGN